ncbi:Mitochondrial ribosomal protein S18C [Paragonimus heterotremus]|uniref:Mitochondrial ribosomal protein S18C n=1 Tax=Paragonimus heterotremus TaxID=100268 RepID=A0A8J4WJN2_9TREM|nr:Mitochondrial ribosomal protein S18C [Paragonimus heterotremus]
MMFSICEPAYFVKQLCGPLAVLGRGFTSHQLTSKIEYEVEDEPISIPDPYKKVNKKCILCEHNVPLDYKNVRLLSQFVSPFTGRIYGRHITGLCIPMQKRISQLIARSRQFGFMPFESKESVFIKDVRIMAKPAK